MAPPAHNPSPAVQSNIQDEAYSWYMNVPTCTRILFTSALVISALGNFQLLSPYVFILKWPALRYNFQFWRLTTNFFFAKFGFGFLMQLYFLYSQSKSLESENFSGRQGDYFYFLVLMMLTFEIVFCVTIQVMGLVFSYPLMMEALVGAIVYLWSMLNRERIVNFMFGIRVQAKYFPFVLALFDVLSGRVPYVMLMGYVAGHLYYFLEEVYPKINGGIKYIQTPQFILNLVPNAPIQLNQSNSSSSSGGGAIPKTRSPASANSTWGKGQRLG